MDKMLIIWQSQVILLLHKRNQNFVIVFRLLISTLTNIYSLWSCSFFLNSLVSKGPNKEESFNKSSSCFFLSSFNRRLTLDFSLNLVLMKRDFFAFDKDSNASTLKGISPIHMKWSMNIRSFTCLSEFCFFPLKF